MGASRFTPDQLEEIATKHLPYEVAMLIGANKQHREWQAKTPRLDTLALDDPQRVTCTMWFEGVLIHARVLHEFLTIGDRKRSDDVWAGDFLADWNAPNPGPLNRAISASPDLDVKKTIDKQLAHMTIRRINKVGFVVSHIAAAVVEDMRLFTDQAVPTHPSLAAVQKLLSRA